MLQSADSMASSRNQKHSILPRLAIVAAREVVDHVGGRIMIGDLLSQGFRNLTRCMHCLGLKSYLLSTEKMPLIPGVPGSDQTVVCPMF